MTISKYNQNENKTWLSVMLEPTFDFQRLEIMSQDLFLSDIKTVSVVA